MYDYLIDENPDVQERISKAKARERIRVLRWTVVNIVKSRSPDLTELAEECVQQIDDPDKLDHLIVQICITEDEEIVRRVLQKPISS